jgi:subtilisin family serine protease
MAKNIITVGNSENLRTEINSSANNIDELNEFSSRGPAADGRVKPDVVAPGTFVTGARAGTGSMVMGHIDNRVSFASGTSHSAPQVAGAAALFTQYWKNQNGGLNPSPALS